MPTKNDFVVFNKKDSKNISKLISLYFQISAEIKT
jgi:hypothetical protein